MEDKVKKTVLKEALQSDVSVESPVFPLAPTIAVVTDLPQIPRPGQRTKITSVIQSDPEESRMHLMELKKKFPEIQIGVKVAQWYKEEYGMEPSKPKEISKMWSVLLLEFIKILHEEAGDWFDAGKSKSILAWKSLAWSMHCYDPACPFFEPAQLSSRASYLKQSHNSLVQKLMSAEVKVFDDNLNWIGERDVDGVPVTKNKVTGRQTCHPYLELCQKIQPWAEACLVTCASSASPANSESVSMALEELQILGKRAAEGTPDSGRKRQKVSYDAALAKACLIMEKMSKIIEENTAKEEMPPLPPYVDSWNGTDVLHWCQMSNIGTVEDHAWIEKNLNGGVLRYLSQSPDSLSLLNGCVSFQTKCLFMKALMDERMAYFPNENPLLALTTHTS